MWAIVNLILGLMLVPFLSKETSRLYKAFFVLLCASLSPFCGIPTYLLYRWIFDN